MGVLSTRQYRSTLREAQAESTRQAILDSAHQLFLKVGYSATSLRRVAEAAQVSEPTVYKVFGDKPSLLVAVGERVVSAGTSDGSQAGRDYLAEIRSESEIEKRLTSLAAWSRSVWEGGMLEFESMLLDAAGTDARAAEVAQEVWDRKYEESRALTADVFKDDSLPGRDDADDVADLLFALDSAAFVRILIHDRGWSFEKYERWLVTILERLFVLPTA